jgi:hypothetical protein
MLQRGVAAKNAVALAELRKNWDTTPAAKCAEIMVDSFGHYSARELSDILEKNYSMVARLIRTYKNLCDEARTAWVQGLATNAWAYKAAKLDGGAQLDLLHDELSRERKVKGAHGRPSVAVLREIFSEIIPSSDYDLGVRDALEFVLGMRKDLPDLTGSGAQKADGGNDDQGGTNETVTFSSGNGSLRAGE